MPPSSSSPPQDPETLDDLSTAYDRLRQEIGKVIVGQEDIIEMVVVCLLARGHTLLIGVPGLAKTLLVRTLAGALDLDFSRIQFTPDLMPSDITGTEIIQETRDGRHFEFAAGPIFANVILADEINRTPPKTQAALLEAMQEQHVTAAGETHTLDDPFFVLATQNPIEQEGTYPLPEAQLDRFMLNLWLDYPSFDEETEVVRSTTAGPQSEVSPVMSADELQSLSDIRPANPGRRQRHPVRRSTRHPNPTRLGGRPRLHSGLPELRRRAPGLPVPRPGRKDPLRPGRPHDPGGRGCSSDGRPRATAPHRSELQRRGGRRVVGRLDRPAPRRDVTAF